MMDAHRHIQDARESLAEAMCDERLPKLLMDQLKEAFRVCGWAQDVIEKAMRDEPIQHEPCLRCHFRSDPNHLMTIRCNNVLSDFYSRPLWEVKTCAEFVAASGQTEATTRHEA